MSENFDDYYIKEENRIQKLLNDFLNEVHKLEKITKVVAIISLICSLSVVIILLIRYNKLVKNKPFSLIILIIAISDSFASLCFSFGYPKKELCITQSVMLFFFERLSWYYTTILVYQLQNLIINKSILKSKWLHISVFLINILLEVLPFSTNTRYGTLEQYQGIFICSMHNDLNRSQESSYIWLRWLTQYSYYTCLALILIFYIRIFLFDLFPDGFCSYIIKGKIPLLKNTNSSSIMIDAKLTSSLYIFAMLISWTPNITYGSYSLNIINDQVYTYSLIKQHTEIIKINDTLDILCPTYGLFMAIIFYIRTKEARKEWGNIFYQIFRYDENIELDDKSIQSIEADRISESELTNVQKKVINDHDHDDLIGII